MGHCTEAGLPVGAGADIVVATLGKVDQSALADGRLATRSALKD
jgi:hypothetical protein